MESLTNAAGATVLGYITQKRHSIHPAHFVGSGKAEQIGLQAEKIGANLIIFDNDLSPAQIRELEKITQRKVLDRSVLILDIFASRARSAEAKIQVELAQMEYTYPRLTRMWSHLDTVAGGASAVSAIGTRGPGEKQLEIDRRLVQKRISALRRQIESIDKRKERQVLSRKHFTVSVVGYTNAGKSTLMNLLTGTDTLAVDKLFATLDTKTAMWRLGKDHSVLLSDTVGFVRDLPHHLVASFRATLEEAIHADLLLHVVDLAHSQAELQLRSANKVLEEIGCKDKDMLLIFNKVDQPAAQARLDTFQTLYPDAIALSARSGQGTDQLLDAVTSRVTGQRLHLRIACSQADGRIPHFLRANGDIISEDYQDSKVILEAFLGSRQLPDLKRLHPQACDVVDQCPSFKELLIPGPVLEPLNLKRDSSPVRDVDA